MPRVEKHRHGKLDKQEVLRKNLFRAGNLENTGAGES